MNKQKFLRILFVLFIVLAVVFGILLILPDTRDNVLGRIGLWCGFVSQLLLAGVMYSEIRKLKKGEIGKKV
jgi:succinate-acetate transporter protein